jgi:hypothetical protein
MFYQTRDLVALREQMYDGQDLKPGDVFRPISEVDSDYLISRKRAALHDADAFTPDAPVAPEAAKPADAPKHRGRPPNTARVAVAAPVEEPVASTAEVEQPAAETPPEPAVDESAESSVTESAPSDEAGDAA